MGIKEIFARQGEAGFRAFERAACLRTASRTFTVIATGGGALLDPESRSALESSGVVILLTCEMEVLLARLRESARRGERPMNGIFQAALYNYATTGNTGQYFDQTMLAGAFRQKQ